ncbi:response regulator [Dinghuibacter silviterrae]|uniref:LuxR family two component transcriptional regulator n=1 Tax=Dinghuibacter silviterrae TaxID=1539049 RepID=A0A4R8DVL6_9BACT|nr:response regulator transcription factor [Dinghuibacter silviterrae]TDX01968.1 LuxR family two component transcriptional regulator [Dinghuibacter silviterrae]
MMRILIADDHTVVRKGLRQILLEAFPSAEIEEASDAESLVREALMDRWDVVITDLSMPGRSGLDALHQLKQELPKLPILVLSIHPEEQYAIRVLRAGAAGYLSKDMASEELVGAVQRVLLGKKYISPAVAEKLASSLDLDDDRLPHEQLSDREFDVLKLIAVGKSITEIAQMLSLSPTTISTYRSRILTKLGLKTNADLILYALEHHLVAS